MRRLTGSRLVPAAILLGAGALFVGIIIFTTLESPETATEGGFPRTFEDDLRHQIEIEQPPARIVSLAPHFTETLFSLGLGRRLVGVSGGETRPPEATALPALVGADGFTPDPGKVRRVRPDLVLASGGRNNGWKRQIGEAGIALVSLEATSVADALADLSAVARLTGRADQGEELRSVIGARLDEVRRVTGSGRRPKVFLETFADPLTAAPSDGYLADLVEAAGGIVVQTPKAAGGGWTPALIAKADPDLYLASQLSAGTVKSLESRPGFDAIEAVKKKRVFLVDDELIFRPGPRLGRAAEHLARLIHPEAFG